MPTVDPAPLFLGFITQNLRLLQAEQRSVRSELRAIGERIDGLERSFGDRVAGFEAQMETRFDRIQTELSHNMQTIIDALAGPSRP